MATLEWGTSGTRYFEAGVSHGVLYIDGVGYAWNGLISVNENPSGGEAQPYYMDGFKYLNTAAAEEFAATIDAFGAPLEFAACEGRASISNGLFAEQQPRKKFGFSYRTGLGDDILGLEYGYKIHLVYNALAGPSGTTHTSLSDRPEAGKKQWAFTTNPPWIEGRKPTAHFIIDSTQTPPGLMLEIEEVLYGSATSTAYLPTPEELIRIFDTYETILLTYDAEDGSGPVPQTWRFYNGGSDPTLPPGREALWLSDNGDLYYVSGD